MSQRGKIQTYIRTIKLWKNSNPVEKNQLQIIKLYVHDYNSISYLAESPVRQSNTWDSCQLSLKQFLVLTISFMKLEKELPRIPHTMDDGGIVTQQCFCGVAMNAMEWSFFHNRISIQNKENWHKKKVQSISSRQCIKNPMNQV